MTRAEESIFKTRWALGLREKGYTNVQIAKRIGWSYGYVTQKIGPQPKKITSQSQKLATSKRLKTRLNNRLDENLPKMVYAIYNRLLLTDPAVMQKVLQENSAALTRLYARLAEMNLADDKAA